MGRPPKTAEQHRRDGTFNVTRHRDRLDSSAFSSDLVPDPPDELSDYAKETWRRLARNFPKDQLKDVDWEGVYTVSFWFGEFRSAALSGDRKYALEAFDKFAKMSGRFGMSPSDRAKLRMLPSQKQDDDPFEQLRAIG